MTGLLCLEIQLVATMQFSDKLAQLGKLNQLQSLAQIKGGYSHLFLYLQIGHLGILAIFLFILSQLCRRIIFKHQTEFIPYLTTKFGYRHAALVFAGEFLIIFSVAYFIAAIIFASLQPVIVSPLSQLLNIDQSANKHMLAVVKATIDATMPTKLFAFDPTSMLQPSPELASLALLNPTNIFIQYLGVAAVTVVCVYFITSKTLKRLFLIKKGWFDANFTRKTLGHFSPQIPSV